MASSRLLTINIRQYLVNVPRRKRHMKVVRYVRERISHYTKVEEDKVKITQGLNSIITKRHVKSMLPLKLSINIDNGVATVTQFVEKAPAAAKAAAPAGTKTAAKPTQGAKASEKPAPAVSAPKDQKPKDAKAAK